MSYCIVLHTEFKFVQTWRLAEHLSRYQRMQSGLNACCHVACTRCVISSYNCFTCNKFLPRETEKETTSKHPPLSPSYAHDGKHTNDPNRPEHTHTYTNKAQPLQHHDSPFASLFPSGYDCPITVLNIPCIHLLSVWLYIKPSISTMIHPKRWHVHQSLM